MDKLGDMSDEELLARLCGHVGKGNVWCAELIAYLVEVDERRLDRVHACSSMWDFCTRKLGMSEGEAHRRIAAARTVRSFPQVLGYIERGEIHLCALYALRKYLTSDNVDELLGEASRKSTREVEKMVAARFPRPDVPASVEPVARQVSLSPVSLSATSPVSVSMHSDSAPAWSLSLAPAPGTGPRPRIEPLSAARYRIELTVSAETKEAIDHIKDLMRHRNPTGDLETILDASLGLLLAQLEKERLGKTSRPRGRRRKPSETTTAVASSACAHAEITTRAPTLPVRVDASASEPTAPVRSEASIHAPHERARAEKTVGDLVAHVRSEASIHAPHELARVESTAGDAAADVHAESRTDGQGAHVDAAAHAHAESRTDGRGAHVDAHAESRADGRGAHVHADAPSSAHDVSAREPASAEPSTAEPVGVEARLGAEATAAARRTWPATSTTATKASRAGSRYVPTAVRCEVFARDGKRCTYVGPDGDRCPARGYLELDHVRPKAHGGTETAANLRVRCRAHNALYADQVFGRAHVAARIDLRRRKNASPTPTIFETAARGLRSMGFREPDARRALETLATTRDMEGASIETLLREALLVLT